MPDSEFHIRRARRTDFTVVMQLLAASDVPVPPPDRATLRRFRNIVKDLGGDFYLAFRGELLRGLVYATYSRQLAEAPLGRIEQLVVHGEEATSSATALLDWIKLRAAKHGCVRMHATDGAVRGVPAASLQAAGLTVQGDYRSACVVA